MKAGANSSLFAVLLAATLPTTLVSRFVAVRLLQSRVGSALTAPALLPLQITPESDPTWQEEDSLDQGRTMGQFIILPDGRLWMGNGGALGTAGYGNESCQPGDPPVD